MATYDTVANIVGDVAIECGLPAVSDVFASTDSNVVQLRTLLKSVGRALVLKHEWLQTTKEHTFVTTSATSYALPADFQAYVDQTGWNRTSQVPLQPVSPQQWQRLKAQEDSASYAVLFRPRDTTLEVWPQPPASGETIAFEYRSSHWVRATASASPDKDAPTVNTDVVHLGVQLITRALKFKFLRDKGFDAAEAWEEFKAAFEAEMSANIGAAPVLSLTPGMCKDSCNSEFGFAVGATGFGFNNEGGLY